MSTPIRRQYLEVKKQHPEAIVFFRLGDFYETFDTDAQITARELDIVLTGRDMGKGNRIPMAGIPYHAAENYIAKLISRGYKVAICEQIGEPNGRDLVRREVTRVVTPGTVVEPSMLQERSNNYLVGAVLEGNKAGLCFVDITTGEFFTTQIEGPASGQTLQQEIARLQPSELLVPRAGSGDGRPGHGGASVHRHEESSDSAILADGAASTNEDALTSGAAFTSGAVPTDRAALTLALSHRERELDASGLSFGAPEGASLSHYEDWHWQFETAKAALLEHFEVASLEGFGCARLPMAVRAAGAVLQYLRETQLGNLVQLTHLATYSVSSFMALDPQTRRNLELVESVRGASKKHSLLGVLDRTRTAMGGRLLGRWLNQPLLDLQRLHARLDAVGALVDSTALRAEMTAYLNRMPDLERLTNRVVQGIAGPRDLVALRNALEVVPAIREALEESDKTQPLEAILTRLNPCDDLAGLIAQALVDDPPASAGTGEAIRPGFSPELDNVKDVSGNAKQWIAALERSERDRSGIKSLKVGYNKVFGYYIEVTSSNLENVPSDYIRKQTLVGAERFITPDLKEYESTILNAQEKIADLETTVFKQVVEQLATASERLLGTARALAHLDVFLSLADVAAQHDYVRPTLIDGPEIKVIDGRHPVVEVMLTDEAFIPNDVHLSTGDDQVIILTGPNMAGKSTYLRMAALIVLMAQVGSFVPAREATIGLVDRIFTRVGAQDDIATGQSTFMVEMVETANILNHATKRSLVILDEIGRGTSTYDGLAIARAVVEYIHNSPRLGAKTLFATHYHELTEMAEIFPRVRNYNVAVAEEGDKVIFLRRIVPGGADRSYGIHVARLAGLPRSVIRRAEEVLTDLERSGAKANRRRAIKEPEISPQLALFSSEPDPVLEELKKIQVDELSPLEAITKLYELQKKINAADPDPAR